MKKISLLGMFVLTACVTINIYFPAAAAEKVADEIIKDIQNNTPQKPQPKLEPKSEVKPAVDKLTLGLYQVIDRAINLVIANAQAEEANLTIDSPEIRQLTASLEQRFPSLRNFYGTGAVGIQADGLLVVRDAGSVALKDRNQINKLVAAENADRLALYQAIANANGHPGWVTQIKATFADRWVSNAQTGWWYQSGGVWKQK